MKKLHRMILQSLPGPFMAALGTLVLLLLLQFLMSYLKDIVGRGLPFLVIVELVSYSLAYMLSLAVPMSLLLATLLVFGRLADSQAYAVAKSTGISLARLAWPMIAVAVIFVGAMSYFNAVMLPEANHRMRTLWQDIRLSKPGFELEPGVFYQGLDGYAIRVADAPATSNELFGVLIFDRSRSGREATIVAESGQLTSTGGGNVLEMTLLNGEIHSTGFVRGERGRIERYERIAFARHRLSFDLSDLTFERSGTDNSVRTGRTMRASQLIAQIDSIETLRRKRTSDLRERIDQLMLVQDADIAPAPPRGARQQQTPGSPILADLSVEEQRAVVVLALQRARTLRSEIDAVASTAGWEQLRADRFRVEYYKKYSMALASLVFVLIGIPLGLMVRRRGYGWSVALAGAVFLFYWMTLVQGEKLADRGVIPPWIGIWTVNVVGGIAALALFIREMRLPAGLGRARRA
jgi:lipopolysaccharide export system permease protein